MRSGRTILLKTGTVEQAGRCSSFLHSLGLWLWEMFIGILKVTFVQPPGPPPLKFAKDIFCSLYKFCDSRIENWGEEKKKPQQSLMGNLNILVRKLRQKIVNQEGNVEDLNTMIDTLYL